MDSERIRYFCLSLPHVVETIKWKHYLAYWVGDREAGGKMFAMIDIDGARTGVLSFHCGVERFHELLEVEGLCRAPYMFNHSWVALERWNALRPREIEQELVRAHGSIYEKLPMSTKEILNLPEKQRAKLIRERRKQRVAKGINY
ncbi:MAG: MmcQ/YjbR family DNA-binding protein [Terracidiphilus sp.]|jgi:predicted DNA-binding protein (MmcQ/YjbR family)